MGPCSSMRVDGKRKRKPSAVVVEAVGGLQRRAVSVLPAAREFKRESSASAVPADSTEALPVHRCITTSVDDGYERWSVTPSIEGDVAKRVHHLPSAWGEAAAFRCVKKSRLTMPATGLDIMDMGAKARKKPRVSAVAHGQAPGLQLGLQLEDTAADTAAALSILGTMGLSESSAASHHGRAASREECAGTALVKMMADVSEVATDSGGWAQSATAGRSRGTQCEHGRRRNVSDIVAASPSSDIAFAASADGEDTDEGACDFPSALSVLATAGASVDAPPGAKKHKKNKAAPGNPQRRTPLIDRFEVRWTAEEDRTILELVAPYREATAHMDKEAKAKLGKEGRISWTAIADKFPFRKDTDRVSLGNMIRNRLYRINLGITKAQNGGLKKKNRNEWADAAAVLAGHMKGDEATTLTARTMLACASSEANGALCAEACLPPTALALLAAASAPQPSPCKWHTTP